MPFAKTPAASPLTAVLATTLALLLAGCGHGGKGGDAASAENVEMPAEEAMRGLDAAATPAPDAQATTPAAEAGEPATAGADAAPPPATAATPSAAAKAASPGAAKAASNAAPIRM